ncbi:MAG: TonB-dependent receptor, partial [Acidobacteriota bacterium]|nr:TonB-dependent receptor [Acidobacteriota bacterium]
YDVKVDYSPTDKDRVSVRLSYGRPSIYQAPSFGAAGGPGGASQGFEGTGLQRTYSAGINYDRVFSPSLITEFRAGVAYYNNIATPADYGSAASTQLGIPGINLDQLTSGIVGINFTSGSFFNGTNPLIGYSASMPWVRAEANIDVVDTWTKIIGNHTIKWGGDFRRIRDNLLQGQTFSLRGLYTFASGQTALNTGTKQSATSYYNQLASLLLDVPEQAGRDLAPFFPAIRGWQLFGFVQNRWTVSPKLTLNYGVRWEFYPPYNPQFPGGFSNYIPTNNSLVIAGVGGNPMNAGLKTHYGYFAPRFGIAYRVTESTVVRAGFGISYTPFPDNNYAFNYPVRTNNSYNPAVATYGPAVLSDGVTPATFQNGFPQAVLPAIPSNGILSAPITQAYFTLNPNFKNPYVESWNIAVQQALPAKFVLTTSYVANHGVDSVSQYNLNAATVAGLGNAGLPEYHFGGRTSSTTLLFGPYSSMYNSLQVKLDRQFSAGLMVTTAYTYGKGMGFQNDDDGGLDFYINQRRNYARNDFDRTNTFVQSYLYQLPFGPGKRWLNSGLIGNIFGNWRVNGILTLMSGLPMTLTPTTNNLNAPGNTQTVDQIAPVQILHGVGANSPWFSGASFSTPANNGQFGNTGRNFLNGPGFFNLDASVFKVITYRERYTFEIRGEAFSVTNTPQFNNPGTTLGTSSFGYITSAGGGNRTFQLGLKLNF